MAKAGTTSRVGGRQSGSATKDRIVAAAAETLKREGFTGTSARAVARTGGFNQALVFYHFGSVNDLLLAVLDATGEARMRRYAEAVAGARRPADLVEVASEIYREDLDAGHLTVLAEMIAGASSVPDLGPAIARRLEPWIDFTADQVRRLLPSSDVGDLLPPDDVAFAVVALYLGMEMLTGLSGERHRAESLFSAAGRLLALFAPPDQPQEVSER